MRLGSGIAPSSVGVQKQQLEHLVNGPLDHYAALK